MLGAMNSKNIFLLTRKRSYFSITTRFFHKNSNLNLKNNDPNSKNKWKIILGRKRLQKHAHILAHIIIKNNKKPIAEDINEILSYCNINITQEELIELINLPKYTINTKNKKEMIQNIKDFLGLQSSKVRIPGVYIFTYDPTGSKYIGSSSHLAVRLNNYIYKKDKSKGILRPLLYKEGINNFSLEVIPIVKN
jgi:hypothetical protein